MRVLGRVGAVAILLLSAGAAWHGAEVRAEDDRTPVVVELFTSEGCSSCPPADSLLEQLVKAQPVAGARVIGLGLHVDYWDQLGWRDRFSSAASTDRQRVYGEAFRVEAIYTPQMVVDGRAELVCSNARAASAAIARAAALPHGRLSLTLEAPAADSLAANVSAVGVPAPGKGDRDEAVVAVIEDGLRSDVRGGENRGRALSHAAVVRSLVVAGDLALRDGAAQIVVPKIALGRDWDRARLSVVAMVQERRSRRIVAAAARAISDAR